MFAKLVLLWAFVTYMIPYCLANEEKNERDALIDLSCENLKLSKQDNALDNEAASYYQYISRHYFRKNLEIKCNVRDLIKRLDGDSKFHEELCFYAYNNEFKKVNELTALQYEIFEQLKSMTENFTNFLDDICPTNKVNLDQEHPENHHGRVKRAANSKTSKGNDLSEYDTEGFANIQELHRAILLNEAKNPPPRPNYRLEDIANVNNQRKPTFKPILSQFGVRTPPIIQDIYGRPIFLPEIEPLSNSLRSGLPSSLMPFNDDKPMEPAFLHHQYLPQFSATSMPTAQLNGLGDPGNGGTILPSQYPFHYTDEVVNYATLQNLGIIPNGFTGVLPNIYSRENVEQMPDTGLISLLSSLNAPPSGSSPGLFFGNQFKTAQPTLGANPLAFPQSINGGQFIHPGIPPTGSPIFRSTSSTNPLILNPISPYGPVNTAATPLQKKSIFEDESTSGTPELNLTTDGDESNISEMLGEENFLKSSCLEPTTCIDKATENVINDDLDNIEKNDLLRLSKEIGYIFRDGGFN